MEDMNMVFCRMMYNGVAKDLRKAFPGIKTRDYWTYNAGLGLWEVQGPNGFYWYGQAGNAWEAKYKAFMTILPDDINE